MSKSDPVNQRWTLLRDVGLLQCKLIVDGLRDVVLVPASLVAALISLVTGKAGRPGPEFYQLLGWGKQSEVWINLFGALRNAPDDVDIPHPFGKQDMDDMFTRIETFVVDEVKRGGVTSQAKERLDKVLDAMQRKTGSD